MSPQVALIIGALIGLSGSIVSAVVQVINHNRAKKAEERKHYQELLFKVGFDWWKYETDKFGVKTPLEEYITRMDAFYALFIEESPNEEKTQKKHAVFKAFLEERNKRFNQHGDS